MPECGRDTHVLTRPCAYYRTTSVLTGRCRTHWGHARGSGENACGDGPGTAAWTSVCEGDQGQPFRYDYEDQTQGQQETLWVETPGLPTRHPPRSPGSAAKACQGDLLSPVNSHQPQAPSCPTAHSQNSFNRRKGLSLYRIVKIID